MFKIVNSENILKKLREDWFPEQIAGRLKNVDTNITSASQRVIYKFIYSVYGRNLERCLRYKDKKIGCPIYFCHPYHAWKKGRVENTNKLIRQYMPKRTDISKLRDEYIKEVEKKL